MLGLTFSSITDWSSYIISIAKTASNKIGALMRSMKFVSPEVALYLYKSTICPCMEYYCHVWAGASSCYLELLDKLQSWICRSTGPLLATSLEPLAHHRNVAGHVHKYEALLWTSEKFRKTSFCYKMINFLPSELKFSENLYFSYTERLALAKVKKVLPLERSDKKVTLLLIYHISGF